MSANRIEATGELQAQINDDEAWFATHPARKLRFRIAMPGSDPIEGGIQLTIIFCRNGNGHHFTFPIPRGLKGRLAAVTKAVNASDRRILAFVRQHFDVPVRHGLAAVLTAGAGL
jgi:hypothetical protein